MIANKVIDAREFVKALPRTSKLNKTERRYADMLEDRKRDGFIQDYFVQAISLKLGEDCRYHPDFCVIESDGVLVFVEVKGFMRDDALVKFRAAQEKFWWARFIMVRWNGKTKCWDTIRQ